jgi:hypothetical protein
MITKIITILIGAILFFEYILCPLCVRLKIIRLPLELLKYKKLIRKLYVSTWVFWLAQALLAFVVLIPMLIHVKPNYSLTICATYLFFASILLMQFLKSLSNLCPRCGHRQKRDFRSWGVDTLLIGRHCKSCNFKFDKIPDVESKNNVEKGDNNLLKYLLLAIIVIFPMTLFIFPKIIQVNSHYSGNLFYISIFLIIIPVLFIIIKKSIKPEKCSICSASGQDNFCYGDGRSTRFCRKHLLGEFKKEYFKFNKKMVVIYPDLENRLKSCYTYQYYTNKEIGRYNLIDEIGDLTKRGLNSIVGTCQKCSAPADVAFFNKGSFRWEDDCPKLEEIDQEPEVLCKECVFDIIISSLNNFKGNFSEPVIPPQRDEGILMPWL